MNYSNLNKLLAIAVAVFSLFLISSCGDDGCDLTIEYPDVSSSTTYANDIAAIENYCNQNGLPINATDSGLHYVIDSTGSGRKPTLCDEVNVKYKGLLLEGGTVFDDNLDIPTGTTFGLSTVIKGWGEGMQLFGVGESGMLLIPSYLGYGTREDISSIPPNSVLIFEVTLNSI